MPRIIPRSSENRILDTEDICERLKCSKEKIYALLRNGKLKSKRIGRTYYVTEENFNAFMNDSEPASTKVVRTKRSKPKRYE
jgi:excisionase family DNA binding protein